MKYFIPSIFMMLLIYLFSEMPSEESSLQHSRVIAFFQWLGIDLLQWLGKNTVWWVRKTAHFVIFGTLSLTFLWGFFKNSINKPYGLAWLFSFFYAIGDEIHQYFVPGRAAQFTDILIDSLGATVFLFITRILLYLFKILLTK